LQNQIDFIFTHLGITDRGDFSEIGTEDLTKNRLYNYEKKYRELSNDFARRAMDFDTLKSKIVTLSSDIQEAIPAYVDDIFARADFSDAAREKLEDLVYELHTLWEQRRTHIAEIAVEITKLWDLLKIDDSVRRQFLNSHTVLSAKNVEDCIREAERLTTLRDANLPSIIRTLKADISRICEEIGYSDDNRDDIIYSSIGPDDLDTFVKLDSELIQLKKIRVASRPIIDLIRQRKEIRSEYEELGEFAKRNGDEAQPLDIKVRLHTEKVLRRHRYVLPRVEKKLKLSLIQFREQEGSDFLWNGTPMIEELEDVQLSTSEMEMLKRRKSWVGRRSRSARQSVAPKKGKKEEDPVKQRKSTEPAVVVTQ
jgi:hypothetical protein